MVADTVRTRLRGLLRTDDVDGALLLRPSSSVHTVGMRYDLDVAHLDGDLVVLRVSTMRRWRVGAPVRRCSAVLETRAGVMAGWGLKAGDRLEVREER